VRYLRRERQQSPRAAADAEHAAAKAALLRLRIEEKQRELVRRTDVDALIDGIAGVTLTALSSLPARCAPRGDLAIRRSVEQVALSCSTPSSGKKPPPVTMVASTLLYRRHRSGPPCASRTWPSSVSTSTSRLLQ
jgi:hypothetical protein